MNPAAIALKNRVSTLVVMVLLVVGGLYSYQGLGRLEDPEFTIKDAKITTLYPGASAREVEEEVTEVLEQALQQLSQLKYVESVSRPGLSVITATMHDKYDRALLPQVWDELRRKIGDVQGQLPPGAGPSNVNDDFGDVYGVYFAIYGDGFTFRELKDYADLLEKELLLCTDVAKVVLEGVQQEVIYVEISRARLSALGISEKRIYSTLAGKNLMTPSGLVEVGRGYLRIVPTGELDTVQAIGSVVIEGLLSDRQVFLRDVADIRRGYEDPEKKIIRINGRRAISLGISTVFGGNVVEMGKSVDERLRQLEAETPIGIERTRMYDQPAATVLAVNSFVVSLIQALAIVVGVLLLTMGLRSGLIIGAVLLMTICGTLIMMKMNNVPMERISLGALIIALGMLVDNAIVVTEGVLIGIQKGEDRIDAAKAIVSKTMWPLLGATVIAILAFAAIGASQDKTGEYCRSLYSVIMYSLTLSWLLAVFVTPLLCVMFLRAPESGEKVDPYAGRIYMGYRGFLAVCVRHRWATIAVCVLMLVFAVKGFGFVNQSFFPDATTPQFTVDYWVTEGSHIRDTEADLAGIEKHTMGIEGVTNVFTVVGGGATRFMLTYTPEDPNRAYGQMIVSVDEYSRMAEVMPRIEAFIAANYPDALAYAKPFVVGPGGGSDVEARLRGPDHAVLRRLSEEVKDILRADPDSRDVRDDWREKTQVVRPIMAEPQAGNLGITRADVSRALQRTFGGEPIGLYRERDELIPIYARAPGAEGLDVANTRDIQIWSPSARQYVPILQVFSGFELIWEDNIVGRRDRLPTIVPQCNAAQGSATRLLERVRPQIEAIDLPDGYELQWGGEYEDSGDAQAALAGKIPTTMLMMVLIVIFLFNALRQPAIVWATVPFAIVGVSVGLLATGQAFSFMAILGLLSLIGMMIKNAIVLTDEVDDQIKGGKPPLAAALDAGVSRLRPVSMAAATTVLGMIPLLPDVFFSGMAVTIMAGLSFATVITLILVPVLYATFFGLKYDPEEAKYRGM